MSCPMPMLPSGGVAISRSSSKPGHLRGVGQGREGRAAQRREDQEVQAHADRELEAAHEVQDLTGRISSPQDLGALRVLACAPPRRGCAARRSSPSERTRPPRRSARRCSRRRSPAARSTRRDRCRAPRVRALGPRSRPGVDRSRRPRPSRRRRAAPPARAGTPGRRSGGSRCVTPTSSSSR